MQGRCGIGNPSILISVGGMTTTLDDPLSASCWVVAVVVAAVLD